MKFLEKFKKDIAKLETASVGIHSTETWLSTGNYALNRALSGSFTRGIPLGRITLFAGPSGCLPANEKINAYIFKTDPDLAPRIQRE